MARPGALDCQMCGLPRPGKRKPGICGPCFDLHLAEQAFNVRRQQASWLRHLAADAAARAKPSEAGGAP